MVRHQSTTSCTGSCQNCPAPGSCAERMVCRCLKITESAIISSIRSLALTTIDEVKAVTGAGDGCMCCRKEIARYLEIYSVQESLIPATI